MTFDNLEQSLQILWLSSYQCQIDSYNFGIEVKVIGTILDENFKTLINYIFKLLVTCQEE